MSRLIQCLGNYAEKPYMIEQTGTAIFSIEELCYYFHENVHVIDVDMMQRELVAWIDRECGLGELAIELYKILNMGSSPSSFVATIMEYTGYYPKNEIVVIERYLKEQIGTSGFDRQMKRAEHYVRNDKLRLAQEEYRRLLEEEEAKDDQVLGRIYHNLGVVYARSLYYDLACYYYEQAYRKNNNPESRRQYLACKKISMNQDDYLVMIGENAEYYEDSVAVEEKWEWVQQDLENAPLKETLREIDSLKQERDTNNYQQEIGRIASGWKEAYRTAYAAD